MTSKISSNLKILKLSNCFTDADVSLNSMFSGSVMSDSLWPYGL